MTDIWGPAFWYVFHFYACHADLNNLDDILNFYKYFHKCIPCDKCSDERNGYPYFYKLLPIECYLTSNYNLFLWTFHIHNMVNKKLNKKIIALEQAPILYNKYKKEPLNIEKIELFCIFNKLGKNIPALHGCIYLYDIILQYYK